MSTRDYYANYYAREDPPPPTARYEEWLSQAEARIHHGRLLEVGAGSGGFARVALARGWDVDAIEVSSTGIQQLRRLPIRVFEGTLEEAGYPNGHFDFVVSIEVLEHVAEPLAHLREIGRILRPGGLLLLSTPNFNGLSRRIKGCQWRVVCPEHLGYFTLRTLAMALARAGFSSTQIRARSVDTAVWGRCVKAGPAERFDPVRSAELRDRVQARPLLRAARDAAQRLLGATGLGDTLLAWSVR